MPEAYHCRYHRRRGEGLRKGRTKKKDCLETDSPFIMRSWLTSAAAEETGRTAAPALGKADVVLSTDAARGGVRLVNNPPAGRYGDGNRGGMNGAQPD